MKKQRVEEKIENLYRRYKYKRRAILAFSIVVIFLLYIFKNASFTIRALSAIATLVAFTTVDHLFDVDFRDRHYVFVILIVVSSFLLSPLYYIYPNYDKIQHVILPVLFSSIIFHMVSKLKLEKKWKLVFTFFIVLGFLGIHEIGEYLLDRFFDLKLQGVFLRDLQGLQKYNILMDRIDDTMIDMSLGTIGSSLYAIRIAIFKKRFSLRS